MLLLASTARAEQIRLKYVLEKGAEACPSETVLRHAILAALKVDPFSLDAKAEVRVVIKRVQGKFEASYSIVDSGGKEAMPRTLPRHAKCAVAVMELGFSLELSLPPLITAPTPPPAPDPAPVEAPPPPPAPDPTPVEEPLPPPPAVAPAPVEEPRSPSKLFSWRFDGGMLETLGTAPGPAFGLAFHMGPRWSFVSLNLGVRGEFAASNWTGPDKISVSRIMLESMPCLHVDPYFFGCGLVQLGQLTESAQVSDVVFDNLRRVTIASVGVRVGHEWALSKPFPQGMSIYVHGDLAYALQYANLSVRPYLKWAGFHVQGALGGGLLFSP